MVGYTYSGWIVVQVAERVWAERVWTAELICIVLRTVVPCSVIQCFVFCKIRRCGSDSIRSNHCSDLFVNNNSNHCQFHGIRTVGLRARIQAHREKPSRLCRCTNSRLVKNERQHLRHPVILSREYFRQCGNQNQILINNHFLTLSPNFPIRRSELLSSGLSTYQTTKP